MLPARPFWGGGCGDGDGVDMFGAGGVVFAGRVVTAWVPGFGIVGTELVPGGASGGGAAFGTVFAVVGAD
jgi:hypothetical protein